VSEFVGEVKITAEGMADLELIKKPLVMKIYRVLRQWPKKS